MRSCCGEAYRQRRTQPQRMEQMKQMRILPGFRLPPWQPPRNNRRTAAMWQGDKCYPGRDKRQRVQRVLPAVVSRCFKKGGKHGTAVHYESPCISGFNSKSQCSDYIISRAFIPPWSLVMTRPETLGPDASSKEAGTLVSSGQLY